VLPKQREAKKLLITEGGPCPPLRLNPWKNIEREIEQNMKTNITPLHDRVIVKRIDEGEQVRGGIIIPDSAKEKPQEGEVIAAGSGKYKEDGTRQPLDVKAGDRILFGKYTSSEIKIDGEELLIMREDEILGIITRAGAAAGGKKRK
jgi:chaperonin GroES